MNKKIDINDISTIVDLIENNWPYDDYEDGDSFDYENITIVFLDNDYPNGYVFQIVDKETHKKLYYYIPYDYSSWTGHKIYWKSAYQVKEAYRQVRYWTPVY